MNSSQTIDITQGSRPPITVTVLDQCRLRFYATQFSDRPDGPGWAQSPSGRYWRLDVPPSVYHALTVGDAAGVLWQGEEILGALDWDAREQEPNATAYQINTPPTAGTSRPTQATSSAWPTASQRCWAASRPIPMTSGGWSCQIRREGV